MKIIKIFPKEVWVDRNNKIAYAKGIKQNSNRLSYNQFRELSGDNNLSSKTIKVSLPSGTSFDGPFRQLSEEEIETRINEILGV